MNFASLDFGAPAAERDIGQGLADYFVESDAYRRVSNRKKFIVLGNRGVGKSAIFKILAHRSKQTGISTVELSPEDYSYEVLSATLRKESEGSWAKHGAYTVAWKYLLLVIVMKELNRRSTGFKSGAAERIYSYLRDHHKGSADTPIGVLLSYLKRMEKNKVQVFIDELDRGWDASEDAKAFVSGLFQAAITLNELSNNLTIFVSLRQELYDSIPALYDDTQKYRDVIETIRWDEPSLQRLICNRIRHSVKDISKDFNDEMAWNNVFSETLQYRQTRSFNYIVDRTLYRPREIIQFCTMIVEYNGRDGVFPIDYATLSKAELEYSEDRAKDIASEYRFQYPGLLSIFEIFRGHCYTFDKEVLESLCMKIALGEFSLNEDAIRWTENKDPSFLIEVLWRIGFLRAQAIGGLKAQRRSGSSYLGPHQITNLNLHNLVRFHVHPMFRAFLAMKETR
jgi:hypothetical protein